MGEIAVQVAKLQFSGVLRVELGPLVQAMNPFAGVGVTFMKRPYVDFSLLFTETDGVDTLNTGK